MTEPLRSGAAQMRFIATLVVFAVLWLVMLLDGRGTIDRRLYEALYAGGHPALVTTARVVTALGEPTVLIGASVLVAVWLWGQGHRHLPVALIAITMIGRALSEAQKYLIARARPGFEPHIVAVKTSSFPSGHASSSMIFFLSLALILTIGSRWRTPAVAGAVLLSVLIGLSRVMLGVHWPSDVIGGWAFGLVWVLVTLRLAQRYVGGDVRR